MSRRADAMKNYCPNCHAPAGVACNGLRGARLSVHRERFGDGSPRSTPMDLTTSQIEKLLADGMKSAADAIRDTYDSAAAVCESPIERLFLAQLLHPTIAAEFETRIEIYQIKSGEVRDADPPPFTGIYVYPQIKIGQFRVDFLLRYRAFPDQGALIVECDGHDFHEKTKEQAQRDKARDRFFVGQGYRIVRFTGSEIYRDPFAAVHEALCILTEIG